MDRATVQPLNYNIVYSRKCNLLRNQNFQSNLNWSGSSTDVCHAFFATQLSWNWWTIDGETSPTLTPRYTRERSKRKRERERERGKKEREERERKREREAWKNWTIITGLRRGAFLQRHAWGRCLTNLLSLPLSLSPSLSTSLSLVSLILSRKEENFRIRKKWEIFLWRCDAALKHLRLSQTN